MMLFLKYLHYISYSYITKMVIVHGDNLNIHNILTSTFEDLLYSCSIIVH